MSDLVPSATAPAPAGARDARTEPAVRRGAKAVVTSASGVLLVKERHGDGRPFWTLPGGGVRSTESLADGLRRELREELRCESVVGDRRATFWYAHRSSNPSLSVYAVFACSLSSGPRPVRTEGILDTAWVDPDDPPATTLPQVRYLLAEATY